MLSNLIAKIKDKPAEYIIAGATTLASLLFAIIWREWLSETLTRTTAAVPTRVVWAILGEALIVVAGLTAYSIYSRRQVKKVQAENVRLQDLVDNPPRVFRFGVDWDKDSTPYCPVHKYPLADTIRLLQNGSIPSFLCPGGHVIRLRDDEGKLLSPIEAKQRFLTAAANPQIESQRPTEQIAESSAASRPSETLDQTLALLTSFRDTLPEGELDMGDVAEYHRLLRTAEQELRSNLREFRIPNTAIKSRDLLASLGTDEYGEQVASFETEQYVPSQIFKRQLNGLLAYLNRK